MTGATAVADDAMLVVLPSTRDGTEAVSPRTVLAGVPVWRRIVLAADRAGFGRIVVRHPDLDGPRDVVDAPAHVLAPGVPFPAVGARRIVFVAGNVVPAVEWLRRLRTMAIEPDHAYVDGASVAVVEASQCGSVLALAATGGGMAQLVDALRTTAKTIDGGLGDARLILADRHDLRGAETWLLRRLVKPNEGVMSRLLERRISLAITRRLCGTRVTPNTMTLVSLGIGFLSAPFFLSTSPAWQLPGALLFLTHSILDGCDGELARLKFQESRLGALLDVVGDNAVHAAVFACMAMGWSLEARAPWPLLLGALAVAGTAWSAVVVYSRGMRASTDADRGSLLGRVADTMTYRDFIYVIVLLAAFGRAHWFVAITAAGAPAFLVLLAWLGRRAR
ncbi:MAG TPA: CDP-alcohol phosphatidyltransferase family protein [Methylomirabilota bacterium]